MEHVSTSERIVRGVLIALVLVFFLFPIFWILLMSFQTNETILRIPPSLFFEPTIANYKALLTGRLETTAGNLDITFMQACVAAWVDPLLGAPEPPDDGLAATYDRLFPVYLEARKAMRPVWRSLRNARQEGSA